MDDDLVEVARQLAQLESGRPRQASLRRSVSTAYYAAFHTLCHACVASLIGWRRRPRSWSAITPIYRALDHGTVKRVFSTVRSQPGTAPTLRQLAADILELQDARLRADYDPQARFTRDEALLFAEQAATAIKGLRGLSADRRLDLVVQLITKHR